MKVQGPDGKVIYFPDGTPQDQIKAAMAKHYPAPKPTPSLIETPSPAERFRNWALGIAPSAGGFAGGLVGGVADLPGGALPGAVGGAAVGGAAGEAAKRFFSGQPVSPSGIAAEGVRQGAYELGGQAIARGAARVAMPVLESAIRATGPLQKKFPGLYAAIMENAIPPTEKGVARARALIGTSSGETQRLLGEAAAAGKSTTAPDISAHIQQLMASPALSDATRSQLQAELDAFMKQFGQAPVDPLLLKGIKQEAQGTAKSLFGVSDVGAGAKRRFAKGIAQGASVEMRRIAPEAASQDLTTQGLMGAERALYRAKARPPLPWNIAQPLTYPVANAVASPANMARLAFLLNSPAFQGIMRQTPRAAAALVSELTSSAPADATQP